MIVIIMFCMACSSEQKAKLPYFNTPDFTPQFLTKAEALKQVTHKVPSFAFTDQDGTIITEAEVRDKIYVADFFFTRCSGICPKMTGNMSKVAAAFENDAGIVLLSHSVTPEFDSVPVLKQYALAKNITQSNWHLLTGDKEQIYAIARKGYFADERLGFSKDTTEFLHTENFILVDRQGRIRGVYNGTLEVEVDNLIRHIKMLKEEE